MWLNGAASDQTAVSLYKGTSWSPTLFLISFKRLMLRLTYYKSKNISKNIKHCLTCWQSEKYKFGEVYVEAEIP